MRVNLYIFILACLPTAIMAQVRTPQEAEKLVRTLVGEALPCLSESKEATKNGTSYSFHQRHTPDCWGGMGDPNTSPLHAAFWVDKKGIVWREDIARNLRYPVGKYTKEIKSITQIDAWQHPTKAIFARYGVVLQKVELYADETYPIFEAEIPKSLSSNARQFKQFQADLLKANSGWACSVWQEDGVQIFIDGKQR